MGPRVYPRETREWTTPLNPTGYLHKRLAAHSCIALCATTLPWWEKPSAKRGCHREFSVQECPGSSIISSVFSGFSENENSWRAWSTGLDLMLCTKIKSQGAQSSADELSAAFLWEKGMVRHSQQKNQERKYYLWRETEDPSLLPQIPSWEVTLWLPSKISVLVEKWRYIYPCTYLFLLYSLQCQSLSRTGIKGYICILSNNDILDCCKIKIHWKYPSKSLHYSDAT